MGYDGVENWRSGGGVINSGGPNKKETKTPGKFDIVDVPAPGPIRSLAFECTAEVMNAMATWPKFNSAHEGFAVLAEEVDELWDEVRINQKRRDHEKMRKECIQIAAMAMRLALEICTEEGVRK